MSRKPAPSVKDWKPSPECDEAFGRILEVAHRSAAAYLGQKPVADPIRDASLVALTHASAMIYFLFRVDPKDLVALASGPGSIADFDHRPFPPMPARGKPRRRTLGA